MANDLRAKQRSIISRQRDCGTNSPFKLVLGLEDIAENQRNASEDHINPSLLHALNHAHIVELVILGDIYLLQVELCHSRVQLHKIDRRNRVHTVFPLTASPLQFNLLIGLDVTEIGEWSTAEMN